VKLATPLWELSNSLPKKLRSSGGGHLEPQVTISRPDKITPSVLVDIRRSVRKPFQELFPHYTFNLNMSGKCLTDLSSLLQLLWLAIRHRVQQDELARPDQLPKDRKSADVSGPGVVGNHSI
jgi:hypothetical protein